MDWYRFLRLGCFQGCKNNRNPVLKTPKNLNFRYTRTVNPNPKPHIWRTRTGNPNRKPYILKIRNLSLNPKPHILKNPKCNPEPWRNDILEPEPEPKTQNCFRPNPKPNPSFSGFFRQSLDLRKLPNSDIAIVEMVTLAYSKLESSLAIILL